MLPTSVAPLTPHSPGHPSLHVCQFFSDRGVRSASSLTTCSGRVDDTTNPRDTSPQFEREISDIQSTCRRWCTHPGGFRGYGHVTVNATKSSPAINPASFCFYPVILVATPEPFNLLQQVTAALPLDGMFYVASYCATTRCIASAPGSPLCVYQGLRPAPSCEGGRIRLSSLRSCSGPNRQCGLPPALPHTVVVVHALAGNKTNHTIEPAGRVCWFSGCPLYRATDLAVSRG